MAPATQSIAIGVAVMTAFEGRKVLTTNILQIEKYMSDQKSRGSLRAPTSSWQPLVKTKLQVLEDNLNLTQKQRCAPKSVANDPWNTRNMQKPQKSAHMKFLIFLSRTSFPPLDWNWHKCKGVLLNVLQPIRETRKHCETRKNPKSQCTEIFISETFLTFLSFPPLTLFSNRFKWSQLQRSVPKHIQC